MRYRTKTPREQMEEARRMEETLAALPPAPSSAPVEFPTDPKTDPENETTIRVTLPDVLSLRRASY